MSDTENDKVDTGLETQQEPKETANAKAGSEQVDQSDREEGSVRGEDETQNGNGGAEKESSEEGHGEERQNDGNGGEANDEDRQDDGEEEEEGEGDNGDDEDYDQAEYDEEEVYKLKRHRRDPSQTSGDSEKPNERRRKPKPQPADPEEAIENSKQQSRQRRSRKSAEPEQQEPEEELDEATKERRALEAKIDAALQPSSKRRKKLAGDDLEMMQDEVIAHLRDNMRHAAIADVESIREGQPAVHKVRMLPEVVRVLQKGSLADSILDGNLLESIRIWLEPLPDASLPSFEIQKVLFGALVNLPIKTIHLRESGLGRVVLFYQKSKRPHLSIKRLAQKLIGDWTRPIIGRSDNYRDKRVATADFDPRDALRASRSGSEAPKSSYEESAARRNRAAIPTSSGISYQVAPVSNANSSNQQQGQGSSASKDSQLRRMKTKLMSSGRSGRKKSQVSVEGKDLN